MTARVGDWIQTSTGRAFYVLDPRPEDVDALDVAHGLAAESRFNGQTPAGPYSVAQHSVLVSRRVGELARDVGFPEEDVKSLVLVGLLHDAAEAYVKDIPRPLKRDLVGYATIEARVLLAVFEHFNMAGWLGAAALLPAIVTRADEEILTLEASVLHPEATRPLPWGLRAPAPAGWNGAMTCKPWTFSESKKAWLSQLAWFGGASCAR